jgi:hypothetical protein
VWSCAIFFIIIINYFNTADGGFRIYIYSKRKEKHNKKEYQADKSEDHIGLFQHSAKRIYKVRA